MQADLFGDSEFLFSDCDQQVGTDGDPDLRLYGIGRGAVEGFDFQVLLDPLILSISAEWFTFAWLPLTRSHSTGEMLENTVNLLILEKLFPV